MHHGYVRKNFSGFKYEFLSNSGNSDMAEVEGIHSHPTSKEMMQEKTNELLEKKKLVRLRKLVSTRQIDSFSLVEDSEELWLRLVYQLGNYQIIYKIGKTVFQKTTYTYSGKANGQNDDLCMALQVGIYGAYISKYM